VTPFREDERIDFNAWQRIIDVQMESGVDGLLAAGGQGEFYSLDEEERTVALRFCRQAVGVRAALYGNVGAVSTRETVRPAQRGEAEGIDYASGSSGRSCCALPASSPGCASGASTI